MGIQTIVIGNPGAGKSSILNCLMGRAEFKSGVSLGQGLTTVLHTVSDNNGNEYTDTPGLSDINLRKQAALEIEKALKGPGPMLKFSIQKSKKVFFVITLEAGRVRPDDKTTIKLVLEAVPQISYNYSIVVNKLSEKMYTKLMEDGNLRSVLLASITEGLPNSTCSILYITAKEELEDATDAIAPLTKKEKDFFKWGPSVMIRPEQVGSIEVNNYDKIKDIIRQCDEQKRQKRILEARLARGEQAPCIIEEEDDTSDDCTIS